MYIYIYTCYIVVTDIYSDLKPKKYPANERADVPKILLRSYWKWQPCFFPVQLTTDNSACIFKVMGFDFPSGSTSTAHADQVNLLMLKVRKKTQ